jgi:hypothetical protein
LKNLGEDSESRLNILGDGLSPNRRQQRFIDP